MDRLPKLQTGWSLCGPLRLKFLRSTNSFKLERRAALPLMTRVWAGCSADCFRVRANGWLWRLAMCCCNCHHIYLGVSIYLVYVRTTYSAIISFFEYSFQVFICGTWCTRICEWTEYHVVSRETEEAESIVGRRWRWSSERRPCLSRDGHAALGASAESRRPRAWPWLTLKQEW
jgi:hypothetical protein